MSGADAIAAVADVGEMVAGRVRSGEFTVGTFVGLDSPVALDVVASTGPDWVLVDLEHGSGAEGAVRDAVPIAGYRGAAVIVRVESGERVRAGRVLDMDVAGIMFPRIESVADAQHAVSATRYPPAGVRGVASYNRSGDWGVRRSAREPLVVIQVETLGAVSCLKDIAAVPGVDALFIGPQDLAVALGAAPSMDDDRFAKVVTDVVEACRANGIAAGILAGDVATARRYREVGMTFLALGSDAVVLQRAMREQIAAVSGPAR